MPAVTRHGYAAGQHVANRLDALGQNVHSGIFGLSWWFIRVFVILGGAWGLTSPHTMMFPYLLAAIQEDLSLSTSKVALVNGSVMLGAFCGSFIFGYLADSQGRKYSLMISFFLAQFASGLEAAATNLPALVIFRFISGLGLGGEQPVIAALVMELAPSRLRGRVLIYLDTFWPIGHTLAVVLGREIEPQIGWRATSAFNGVVVLYIILIYLWVPESPKWLAHAGHFEESVRVLRSIERQCSVFQPEAADELIYNLQHQDVAGTTGMYLVQPQKLSFWRSVTNQSRILLRYPYLRRTLVLWCVWMGTATGNNAIDAYLGGYFLRGITDKTNQTIVVYAMILAQIPGTLVASVLIDRIGRKNTLAGFLVLASIGSLLEVYLPSETVPMLFGGCCRTFAFMGAWGSLYAYTPELYPISMRVMGTSYAWGLSRIGSFGGPYTVIWMADHWYMSIATVIWTFTGITFVVAAILIVFGVETAHQDSDRGDYKPSTSRSHEHTATTVGYTKHEDTTPPLSSQPIVFI